MQHKSSPGNSKPMSTNSGSVVQTLCRTVQKAPKFNLNVLLFLQFFLQNLSPISHNLEWQSWFMCIQGSYPWDNQLLVAKTSIPALGMVYIFGNSSEVKIQCFSNKPHTPGSQLHSFLILVSNFPDILWNLSWKFLDLQYSYFVAYLQFIHCIPSTLNIYV